MKPPRIANNPYSPRLKDPEPLRLSPFSHGPGRITSDITEAFNRIHYKQSEQEQ